MTSVERQQHLLDAALPLPGGPEVGRTGLAYCRELSDITDDWVVEIFDRAAAEHPVPSGRIALLAVDEAVLSLTACRGCPGAW